MKNKKYILEKKHNTERKWIKKNDLQSKGYDKSETNTKNNLNRKKL